jgi:hypothetical protein
MYRLNSGFRPFWFLSLALLLSALLNGATSPAAAQSRQPSPLQPSPYWQYDAPGPLGLVAVEDLDGDGTDNFILTTEGYEVVLLDAAGQDLWSYQTPDRKRILQLTAANVISGNGDAPNGDPYHEVVIALEDTLILLDHSGQQLWSQALELPLLPDNSPPGSLEDDVRRSQNNHPLTILPYDHDMDGNEEVLVMLQSGLIQLYDNDGQFMWQYPDEAPDSSDPMPRVATGDLDQDGMPEIVFSHYIRYSRIMVVDGNGELKWDRALSGRITTLDLIGWNPFSPLDIVVGNSFRTESTRIDRVIVYDGIAGLERWRRTPNRPVTALARVQLTNGPALAVGTNAGTVTTYNQNGERVWRYLPENPRRSVVSISANPIDGSEPGHPTLALTLVPTDSSSNEAAAAVLLDDAGQELQRFPSAAVAGQTQLVDANKDGISELMLATFGTLSLTDPGTGARKNAQSWDYRLYAAPLSALEADLNRDGEDELMVGTKDGRLHIVESSSGQATAILSPGGEVAHMALIEPGNDEEILILAAHNHAAGANQGQPAQGILELVQPSGRVVWPEPVIVSGAITALAVGNMDRDVADEIVVGTSGGQLIVYSQGPRELWRTSIPGQVKEIVLVPGEPDEPSDIVVSNEASQVYRFDGTNQGSVLAYHSLSAVGRLFPLPRSVDEERAPVLASDAGALRTLNWQGEQRWQWPLQEDRLTLVERGDDTFLLATGAGHLINFDVMLGQAVWELDGMGDVSALYWGDLDGGGAQDFAVGTRNGQISLFTNDARPWDSFELSSSSSVFYLAGLRRAPEQQPQLVVISDNGVVQLYEAKPNRPPLLVNPQVDTSAGRYDVRITVLEEEGDTVQVALQLLDPASGTWYTAEERVVSGQQSANSRDTLLFSINPPAGNQVSYRFSFDDGTHQGTVTPPPGPVARGAGTLRNLLLAPALVALGILTVALAVRQLHSRDAQVRRFYNKLKQQPESTLNLLDEQYRRTAGSPDFLLSLANRARRDRNQVLADLVDGLFLLSSRPDTALSILNSALADAIEEQQPWDEMEYWQKTLSTAQALWDALNITELSLLYPQLAQLVRYQEQSARGGRHWDGLLEALGSLRDSERVDLVEDRLVYLHEASVVLRQVQQRLEGRPTTIQIRILHVTRERLLGLIKAETEMLRGQARLAVSLKTKRVVLENGQVIIAVEVRNNGRAAAENVQISIEEDAAYEVLTAPETVRVLSAGRGYVADFLLAPNVDDRFRVAFSITYDDRIQRKRHIAFADMVNLLPPQRDFTPIPNPYMPGTPLRSTSSLFFGREELFEFIAENAGRLTQRNVIILVGQRRTGKTSALLRLGQYLPKTIHPVYIDCQSLGVVRGMPALFHDLAWLIADALANDGYEVTVPGPRQWEAEPGRLFQHHFIPNVRRLLPEDNTLLLVFDEFEAFENLVQDKILPPTLFTYMRHLMQHSEGLGFVFVGTRRLEEMSSDYWSVLFNIALYRQIGFLSYDAALKLITQPVAPNIIYDDLALDKIWRVTAGHPYFLQLVCYTLVRRANSCATGYVTISDVNAALEEMLRLGEVHFAYLWQRSTHTERALLAAVAHLMDRDMPFHPSELVQYLEEYGFRFDPAEVTRGLNLLVEREIMREVTMQGTTLYELKIGLVGLWAAQNKSLSKLYESGNGRDSTDRLRTRPERV